MNANILKLKEEIKKEAKCQKETKQHRKTINFTGKRYMSPSDATYRAQMNRIELNCLYAAYARLKGREDWVSMLSDKDITYDIEYKKREVDSIFKQYEETVCANEG